MSWWPFRVEKNAAEYISQRWKSLISTSDIRIMQILELFQYSVVYFFVAFIFGTGLDFLFSGYDENKETWKLIFEVLGQAVLIIIGAFYIKKLVKLMPFVFYLNVDLDGDGKIQKYAPYRTTEYHGEMMIGAIVFIAVQVNFLRKISLLADRTIKFIFNAERSLGSKF
jgi:hypothetical protein